MKQKLPFLMAFLCASFFNSSPSAKAQITFSNNGSSVGVGTASPHPSALIEVKSTTQGVLMPRMTSAQRTAIASPATGLLVYQTDGTPGLYVYNRTWSSLSTTTTTGANASLSNLTTTSINSSLLPKTTAATDIGSSTKGWKNLFLTGTLNANLLNVQNGGVTVTRAGSSSADKALFFGKRSRGTAAAPTMVVKNDLLASFTAAGYDGKAFQNSAAVDFVVDANPTAGNVPTGVSFFTGTNQSNRKVRLKISSAGNVNINDNHLFVEQSTGRVGVGTTSLANARLSVENPAQNIGLSIYNDNYSKPENRIGILVSSTGNNGNGTGGYFDGASYGVLAYGNSFYDLPDGNERGVGTESVGFLNNPISQSGATFGVRGLGSGGAANYGVFGNTNDIWGGAFNAAGYFEGDVHAVNFFMISDRKFKTDINPLAHSVEELMKLKPASYSFKQTDDIKRMGAPEGKQMGLIADEVKQVFPELVKESVKPAYYDKDRKKLSPAENYEAVNYVGLIPVLVSSIQEQQKQIDEQQKQIDELKNLVKGLIKPTGTTANIKAAAYVTQNSPNPAYGSTLINYYVPDNAIKALLQVSDTKGRVLKIFNVAKGTGQLTIGTTDFPSGIYNYSLVVDGARVDTKQMVIAR